MKFTYLILGVAIIALNFFDKENLATEYVKKMDPAAQSSDGEKLVSKMDCVGCHKLDKKLVGPSYLEIAKKYSLNDKNINYLSNKIIKGGSGAWGNIPMAGHSTLKKEDAKSIAKYILSVKN